MSSESDSAAAKALQYISNDRFRRRFTLPAAVNHGALEVSYADVGVVQDPSNVESVPPAILFMPGMFASRYLSVGLHAIAEKLGVRVLVVDRPGMGDSTDVPLGQRISVWVELVPRLLEHLSIEHVALVSHSCGALYLFNTLYHCRSILHPDAPFIALMAPWVDPAHSHLTSVQMLQYIPAKAFGIWNLLPKFFVLEAGPALASSGALIGKFSNMFSPSSATGDAQDMTELEKNRQKREVDYGLPRDVQVELDQLAMKHMFEENTVGANSEALQCLKKGNCSWGKCEDYQVFIRELVETEKALRHSGESDARRKRLKVRTYFAESDALIGKQGQLYMEECWRGNETGAVAEVIDFETQTVAGVDHDTLVQSIETLERIFVGAGGRLSVSTA
ncbi:hypothetical protein G7046_g1894 [Stylonectria norvegica]|nr:hypothetical protein G7046_g1894 [Stylonectria norvegica]